MSRDQLETSVQEVRHDALILFDFDTTIADTDVINNVFIADANFTKTVRVADEAYKKWHGGYKNFSSAPVKDIGQATTSSAYIRTQFVWRWAVYKLRGVMLIEWNRYQ